MGAAGELVSLMADLVSAFTGCDFLTVAAVGKYELSTSAPISLLNGTLPNGTFTSDLVCIPKRPGALLVTLLASELGVPALPPGVPLSIQLTGNTAGFDANGQPLLSWDADYDVDISVPQYNARLRHVHATLMMTLKPDDGTASSGCGGDCHTKVVRFISIGQVVATGTATYLGVDYDVTLKVTDLHVDGGGLLPGAKQVEVSIGKDDCGVGAVEGGTAHFFASLEGIVDAALVSYAWSVDGATLTCGQGQSSIDVTIGPSTSPFTVSLEVTSGACTVATRRTIFPLSHRAASLQEVLCRELKDYTLINLFVNPLGPDIRLPLGEREVRAINAAAHRVASLTDMLLLLTHPGGRRRT